MMRIWSFFSVLWLSISFPCFASEQITLEVEALPSKRARRLQGAITYQEGENFLWSIKLPTQQHYSGNVLYNTCIPYAGLKDMTLTLTDGNRKNLIDPRTYTFLPFTRGIGITVKDSDIEVRYFCPLPPLLPVVVHPSKKWEFKDYESQNAKRH